MSRVLDDLKRLYPDLPSGTNIFWGDLPAYSGFQAGGGAAVRWLYRDPTVNARYLAAFSRETAGKGEFLTFTYKPSGLVEIYQGPARYSGPASALMLTDRLEGSRDAWMMALERGYEDGNPRYWLAWVEWARGDTVRAKELLREAGWSPSRGPAPRLGPVELATDQDTTEAIAWLNGASKLAALDPEPHQRIADLALPSRSLVFLGQLEAWVCSQVDPDSPRTWRRLGQIYFDARRFEKAMPSLERYFALAGPAAQGDEPARRALEISRGMMPGGELARRAVAGWKK
jgi:hypothetical protein